MRSVSNSRNARVEVDRVQGEGRDETRLERLDRNLAEMQDELLVATKLFGAPVGILTLLLGSISFGVMWFVVPLRRRRQLDR